MYLDARLRRYVRQHGRKPRNPDGWQWHVKSPIHALLRLAQGQWPPLSMIESRLDDFRAALDQEGHTARTTRHYVQVARRFLRYLNERSILVEAVTPADLSRFIDFELRVFRLGHGRLPDELVQWRCRLTNGIHALLRQLQGKWPPTPSIHPWLVKLQQHLEQECPDRKTRLHYVHACSEFLAYWEARAVALERIDASHVTTYCQYKLRGYRKRRERLPGISTDGDWESRFPSTDY